MPPRPVPGSAGSTALSPIDRRDFEIYPEVGEIGYSERSRPGSWPCDTAGAGARISAGPSPERCSTAGTRRAGAGQPDGFIADRPVGL